MFETSVIMTSPFGIQVMKDYFNWIHFLTITVFYRFSRWPRMFTLISYTIIIILNIYFFITVFTADFLYQYLASFLALASSIVFNFCFFWSEKDLKSIENDLFSNFLGLGSITDEIKRQLQREVKLATWGVIANSCLGVITGFVVIPLGKERDYQFALFFFKSYFGPFHYIFEFAYFLTFPIVSYTVVNFGNFVAYYAYLCKIQLQLYLDILSHIKCGYENQNDDELVDSAEYQKVIGQRLQFLIGRHIQLLSVGKKSSDLTFSLLPWLYLGGVTMGMSALSYLYLVEADFGYWRYFQIFVWAMTSFTTGALLMHCGQEVEDMTGTLARALLECCWITFNQSNKKLFLNVLIRNQVALKLRFTDKVSVNHKLGLRMVRNVYSFGAVFARVGKNI